MDTKILDLFNSFEFLEGTKHPVLAGTVPPAIFGEILKIVEYCSFIKEHELAFLRHHNNVGQNTYQISLPRQHFEPSFLFPYLNYLGEFFVSKTLNLPLKSLRRQVLIRENSGHFDGYDIWVNYAYKEDVNLPHTHGGTISGVIYVKNTVKDPTVFTDTGVAYNGRPGNIIVFPSSLTHEVKKKLTPCERVTIAFNMVLNEFK